MNDTLEAAELVAQWRNGEDDNPAGPLFAAGQFAEADIVNAITKITCGTACSGSVGHPCC
jgi:hypothetical protein